MATSDPPDTPTGTERPPDVPAAAAAPPDTAADVAPPPDTAADVAPPPPDTPAVIAPQASGRPVGLIRLLGIAVIVAGAILAASGVITWIVVQNQLADEQITVSDDADRFAGDPVDGPLTAYAEADAIEGHALEASGGLTYAELPQDDPTRETVMTASFLRASLFTSVVSFGVAAMAMGLGVVLILIGVALLLLARQLAATPAPTPTTT
jgi:hypothetical protein